MNLPFVAVAGGGARCERDRPEGNYMSAVTARPAPRPARILLAAAVVLTGVATASWAPARQDTAHAAIGEVIFSDDFDGARGAAPDAAKWAYDRPDMGDTNGELQTYTESRRNSSLTGNSQLAITVHKEEKDGKQYTSARIKTQGKVELPAYGRYEASIALPSGTGIWPAFWMLGSDFKDHPDWPQSGEIDIMEYVGKDPNKVFGTVHGPGYAGGASIGNSTTLQNPGAFHTYAVEWSPNLIVWYLDGREYHRVTPDSLGGRPWRFDYPYFIILNVAVGGNFGGPVGPETTFPQTMLVDYVRVYEYRP
jgi:beta-glucanase (GH16 family)